MSGTTDMILVDKDGKRIDGRMPEEHRAVKIEAGVLANADGSAYVEIGKNKVLAAVYGPRECHPRHLQDPTKAIIQCKYNMQTYSVSDRKRPGTDRRSVEISKITAEALEKVVLTELYPRASIDVYIEILQANAGTRCAGLTAASVALADAGIPMRDIIPSIAAGKADGHVLLDLNKEEDNFGLRRCASGHRSQHERDRAAADGWEHDPAGVRQSDRAGRWRMPRPLQAPEGSTSETLRRRR